MNNLWLLVVNEGAYGNNPWDHYYKMLVRAPDEATARRVAVKGMEKHKAERGDAEVFLSEEKTSCTQVHDCGPNEVILAHYVSG